MSSSPQIDSGLSNSIYAGAGYRLGVSEEVAKRRQHKAALRSLATPLASRPSLAHLERACRIALMEEDRPASVEAIYDRIVRRGSVMFFAYKRPFRAIALALSGLASRGEVILVEKDGRSKRSRRSGRRRWQRTALVVSGDLGRMES